METATVSNASTFQPKKDYQLYYYNSYDGQNFDHDADIQFLKAIKGNQLKYDSSQLIQSLPQKPLTEYHLHWLSVLAETRSESRDIIKHILATYKISGPEVLIDYYKQKIHRICV